MPNLRYRLLVAGMVCGAVGAIALSGCASPSGIECKQGSIIALGDSITFGAGLEPGESYPSQLAGLIDRDVCNAGINGDTAGGAVRRLRRDVLRFHPTTVVILLGVNDAGFFGDPTGTGNVRDSLELIIERVRASGATPVLCSLLPIDPERLQAQFVQPRRWPAYDTVVRSVAADEGVIFVDLGKAFGGRLDLLADGVHPSPAGSLVIAQAVANVLIAEKLATPANTN